MEDVNCALGLVSPNKDIVPAVTIYKGMAICGKCLHSIMLNENREESRRPIIISAEEYMQDSIQGNGVHD
jgi:hypothetical protein